MPPIRRMGAERSGPRSLELLALVPAVQELDNYQVLTTQERPVLWFSNPKECPASTSCQIQFQLLSLSTGKKVFEQRQPWSPTQGLIAMTIPNEKPGLEVGQSYRWRITILDSTERLLERVQGDLTRVGESPELKEALAKATTPEARFKAYGAAHIWYETLDGLLQTYQANGSSPDIMKDWQSLQEAMLMDCVSQNSSQQFSSLNCKPKPNAETLSQ